MPKVKTPDSKLVTQVWSGNTYNYNPRNHAIDTITPHHMANGTGFNRGGKGTALAACDVLNSKHGSVQYNIDSTGDIVQMLNEKYRAWTSNSRSNDHRAVTIEVANDGGAPDWHISDKALDSLVKLCGDICRRHGKKKLLWISDPKKAIAYEPKADEMKITLHKWVSETPTGCPEKYMISKMPYLASEVTKLLGGAPAPAPAPAPEPSSYAVRITYKTGLNIRSGPGMNYKVVGSIPNNDTCTIVNDQKVGTQTWGQLSDGRGWICLTGYTFRPYVIRVTDKRGLNVRGGPGVSYKAVGTVPVNGIYTIVEEHVTGTQIWGKLKSGAGWICLSGYTEKIK